VNRPLTADEEAQLQKVADLGGHLAPALPLLVYGAQLSAAQLGFLHEAESITPQASSCSSKQVTIEPDCLTAYHQQHARIPGALQRLALSAGEEQHVLGTLLTLAPVPDWKRRGHYVPIDIPACPVQVDISAYEQQLNQLVSYRPGPSNAPAYPLAVSGTALEQDMHAMLKGSWEVFHTQPEPQAISPDAVAIILLMKVRYKASWLYTYT
jgi:hypothetical protein